MALVKEMTTPYGVNTTYHRIIALNIDWLEKKALVTVGSYAGYELREQDYTPLWTTKYTIANSSFSLPFGTDYIPGFDFTPAGNLMEEAYIMLKKSENFRDAVDHP